METNVQGFDRAQALAVFTRRLSALADIGVRLGDCMVTLSKDGPAPYSEFAADLAARWSREEPFVTLSDAMMERPDLFSPFYVNTVRWGEIGGILQDALGQLAELAEASLRVWTRSGKPSGWFWLLDPAHAAVPRDWSEIDARQQKLILMLWSRSLGLMLAAGVGFAMALKTAADLLPEAQRQWMNETTAETFKQNSKISDALAESGFIPPFLVTMMGIGEVAGNLDDVLEKAALAYEHELEIELS